jgi:DNA primase
VTYATLCSVADHALFRLLEDNPHIRKVVLCLDNDQAGRQAMEQIAAKLHERG